MVSTNRKRNIQLQRLYYQTYTAMSQQINTIKVWSRNRGPTGRRAAKEQVKERR